MKRIISIIFLLLSSGFIIAQDDNIVEEPTVETFDDLNSFEEGVSDDELNIFGVLRNDSTVVRKNEQYSFNDILELRFISEKKSENTQFYADGRVYLFYGNDFPENESYEAKLIRAYVRYYFKNNEAELTSGKTYVNVGSNTLLNPFALNKNINFADKSYDKESQLAIELKYFPAELSEGGAFVIYDPAINNYKTGLFYQSNFNSFDAGFVYVRYGSDKKEKQLINNAYNKSGFYFKGDYFLTLKGSYCFHIADGNKYTNHEVEFGFDYSLYDSKIILDSLFYYNNKGSLESGSYIPVYDSFLKGKYYNYSNITYKYDEFYSYNASILMNLIDYSYISTISMSWVATQNSILYGSVNYIAGRDEDEFSQSQLGDISFLFRYEVKF